MTRKSTGESRPGLSERAPVRTERPDKEALSTLARTRGSGGISAAKSPREIAGGAARTKHKRDTTFLSSVEPVPHMPKSIGGRKHSRAQTMFEEEGATGVCVNQVWCRRSQTRVSGTVHNLQQHYQLGSWEEKLHFSAQCSTRLTTYPVMNHFSPFSA